MLPLLVSLWEAVPLGLAPSDRVAVALAVSEAVTLLLPLPLTVLELLAVADAVSEPLAVLLIVSEPLAVMEGVSLAELLSVAEVVSEGLQTEVERRQQEYPKAGGACQVKEGFASTRGMGHMSLKERNAPLPPPSQGKVPRMCCMNASELSPFLSHLLDSLLLMEGLAL